MISAKFSSFFFFLVQISIIGISTVLAIEPKMCCVYSTNRKEEAQHSPKSTQLNRDRMEQEQALLSTGLWFLPSGRGLRFPSLQVLSVLHTCFSSDSLHPKRLSRLVLTHAPALHSLVNWPTWLHWSVYNQNCGFADILISVLDWVLYIGCVSACCYLH